MNAPDEAQKPASCELPKWHPSRCHVPTEVALANLAYQRMNHTDLVDDYGKVEAHDWLSAPGGFR